MSGSNDVPHSVGCAAAAIAAKSPMTSSELYVCMRENRDARLDASAGSPMPSASAMNLVDDVVRAWFEQTSSHPHSQTVKPYRPKSAGPRERAIHTLISRPSAYSIYVDTVTIPILRRTATRRFMARYRKRLQHAPDRHQ